MSCNSEILNHIASFAPLSWAMDYDNVGLLIGNGETVVSRALVALDASEKVVNEAIEEGFDLLITHHPLIFHPLYRLTDEDPITSRVLRLVRHNISLISMHTNLDAARGGVNDRLAEALELCDITDFENPDAREGVPSVGRIGTIAEMPGEDFVRHVLEKLGSAGIKYVLANQSCHRIAVGGGSCGAYIDAAKEAGCDTLVTADIKYHDFIHAEEIGLNLIDAGHFATENVIIHPLTDELQGAFPELYFAASKSASDPVRVIKKERS